jgi:hypothetical protein
MDHKAFQSSIIQEFWSEKFSLAAETEVIFNVAEGGHFENVSRRITKSESADYMQICSGNFLSEFVIYVSVFNLLLKSFFRDVPPFIYFPDTGKNGDLRQGKLYLIGNTAIGATLKETIELVRADISASMKHGAFDPEQIHFSNSYGLGVADILYQLGVSFDAIQDSNGIFGNTPIQLHIRSKNTDYGERVIEMRYKTEIVERSVAEEFVEQFKHVLVHLRSVLRQAISSLQLVSEGHQNMLKQFNSNDRPFFEQDTMVSLFERQVIETPDAIALETGQKF